MIRLSRGIETLLYPYVESKGNFGKAYSKNMVYAASRYTEAKLAPICHELFDDIKSDTVDFVDNYDNTMKEPTLLPVTFPSILCNVTTGIAAGMASSIASFNLKEICDTTIALMKNPDHEVSDTLLAPDFVGGGYILYDKEEFEVYVDSIDHVEIKDKPLKKTYHENKKLTAYSILNKIRDDIKGEYEAILLYDDLINKIEDKCLVKMIKDITKDEKEHVEELTLALMRLDSDKYGPIEEN